MGGGDRTADDAGEVLRGWRLAQGRNQVEIADTLGISQQALSLMENGRRPLSIEQRRAIVEKLGIEPEALGLASGQVRRLVADDSASAEISASRVRWRAERRWLNQHRSQLAQLSAQLYPKQYRITRTPLLAAPEWQLGEPIPLRELTLTLDEGPQTAVVDGSESATESVRPLRIAGQRFERYTAAVRHLDPPRLFESRPSYRLLDASLSKRRLNFGMAAYFDKLDVSEALGHEIAAVCMKRGRLPESATQLGSLPFRELLGDPFDPHRRALIPAITTLTIRLRRYPAEPSFLLHWRDPAKVATAAGIYDVVPAGEFQPSSVMLWDRSNDFDLWRNVVREYSEELLGEPEYDGTRSAPIDYESWDLFQRLEDAQTAGTISVSLLGMGVDALTLAATILTVVVIDDDVFDGLFGDAVTFNDEGEIVALGDGRPVDGIPFTEQSVMRLLTSEPLASPGAACLSLAWQHRDHLLAG